MVHGNSNLCIATMQNFATQLVGYMAHRGTAPKILIVEPIKTYALEDTRPNDYEWPHYSYTRGCVQNTLGRDKVIAVPVAELSREFPDDFIVVHSSG
jgi:hypothetical protein